MYVDNSKGIEGWIRSKFDIPDITTTVKAGSHPVKRKSTSTALSELKGFNVSLRCVHSGPGVFLYDENVRFMNSECLPHLDRDRDICVEYYTDGWEQVSQIFVVQIYYIIAF